jgi:uncharacterized protein YlxW (UPF0749 family)
VSRRLPPRSRFARPAWAVSVGLGLAVIGFIGAAQWNSSLGRQEFVTSAQRVLVSEAEQLQRQQEQLRAEITEAEDRLRTFQEESEGSQTTLDALNTQVAAARLASGLSEVTGPGVVIEIADSLRPVPEGERPTDYIVLVDDLRDLVTALWGSGAEAITIAGGSAEGISANPERLVATSSIYGVGSSILVNTAFLSPPFRIEAIGPEGLHERFLAHPSYLGRVAQRIEVYGLQFASEARDELTLPAFIGNTRLRWGAPASEEAVR